MSTATAVYRRLVTAGVPDQKAKRFLELVAKAEAGSFDPQTAIDVLRGAQFTSSQSALLLGELLHRLARRSGWIPPAEKARPQTTDPDVAVS